MSEDPSVIATRRISPPPEVDAQQKKALKKAKETEKKVIKP